MSSYLTQKLDRSTYGSEGYYDEKSQYQYIYPKNKRIVDLNRKILTIGAAGAGGILFVMKLNDQAIYAHYPLEQVERKLAEDFDQFVSKLITGDISV